MRIYLDSAIIFTSALMPAMPDSYFDIGCDKVTASVPRIGFVWQTITQSFILRHSIRIVHQRLRIRQTPTTLARAFSAHGFEKTGRLKMVIIAWIVITLQVGPAAAST
jgi:hypothetical protein